LLTKTSLRLGASMMKQIWIDTFRLWAQTDDHANAVSAAKRRVADCLCKASRPYVAFSGGKDSLCMLHLVMEQDNGIMVWHWDYGPSFVPREIEATIPSAAHCVGAVNIEVDTSTEYTRLGRDADNVWGHEFFRRVAPALAERGFDMAFVGLRAEESCARKQRIATRDYACPIDECWPLQDWRWLDVWAYIVIHDLPYLHHYDTVADMVGYDLSRFSTLFDRQFLHLGTEQVDNVAYWRHRND